MTVLECERRRGRAGRPDRGAASTAIPKVRSGLPVVDAEAIAAARELLDAERSEIRTFERGVRAFVEVLEPPLRLLVCGAGHDAIPLVRAARGLGWSPIVVDDRPGS